MQTELKVSKSILAKLLAGENISVVHQQTPIAAFDLKARTLILPMWNDMDGDLYDLLVGHEVGHALYTPEQGWHNSIQENKDNKSFKGFLNVIEDARIEKMIKRKYAGLPRSFAAGYKELYERDMFGIKKLPDVNKLNLIDRINIYFKVGSHVIIKFTDEERVFVNEVSNIETWDQVVDVATRIYNYVKEKEADKLNSQTDLDSLLRSVAQEMEEQLGSDGSEDQADEFDDMDMNYDDVDDSAENDSQESGEDDSEGSEEENDSESITQKSTGGEEENDGEPKSITDNSFRRKEQELVNQSGNVGVFMLPEAKLENIILSNKLVVQHIEEFVEFCLKKSDCRYSKINLTYDQLATKCVNKFNKNNKKYIMHLLKEFEMRKKAFQYARTTQARTGELNMNVLHKYKHSTDLFKKMNIAGKAKNHGMVLFLDMSGSMQDIFRNTLEQLLVLSSFCKLANIPFDVYGFSNDHYVPLKSTNRNNYQPERTLPEELVNVLQLNQVPHEIDDHKFVVQENGMFVRFTSSRSFHLKHLLSSSFTSNQYRKAFNALAIVMNEYNRRYNDPDRDHGYFSEEWMYAGMGLNGTPTSLMLLASREILKTFKQKHKVDIVNTIHLTDGAGDSNRVEYPKNTPFARLTQTYSYKNGGVAYLVDKKTKKKVKIDYSKCIDRNEDPIQTALVELVTDASGCKHIAFRLVAKRDVKFLYKDLLESVGGAELETQKKSFSNNNFMAVPVGGYGKFFYIKASDSSIKDEELKIDAGMTKAKMASAFRNSQTGKRANRILVSKFSEEIAA